MSRPRPDLPNDVASAKAYVDWLANLGIGEKILLAGSRGNGTATADSDWDFVLVTDISPLRIVQPRDMGRLHADLAVALPGAEARFHTAVEVWPTDEKGLLDA